MKIIFLNGPPRSGKDHASKILSGTNIKLSKILKEMTHAAFGLFGIDGRPLAYDYYEEQKDNKHADFGGVTPRAAYIQMSEGFIKPLLGPDYLGHKMNEILERMAHQSSTFLITDSGFVEEARPIVERWGSANCTLVRLHREGYNFKGDSRGYIDLSDLNVPTIDVINDGGPDFSVNLLNIQ